VKMFCKLISYLKSQRTTKVGGSLFLWILKKTAGGFRGLRWRTNKLKIPEKLCAHEWKLHCTTSNSITGNSKTICRLKKHAKSTDLVANVLAHRVCWEERWQMKHWTYQVQHESKPV
jgi:hypothetical protein